MSTEHCIEQEIAAQTVCEAERAEQYVPSHNAAPIAAAPEVIAPLNKYLAHAGVCSRRKAVALIMQRSVNVNGHVITDPGYKVTAADRVTVGGRPLHLEKKVYIILNKLRGYITSVSDDCERPTVMDLLDPHLVKQRIYPIGRLDYDTSGLLLLTNDGDFAQKLSHPKFEVKKVYQVKMDKIVLPEHLEIMRKGLSLEDGIIKADRIMHAPKMAPTVYNVHLHSGKNRIVRRMFEHFGYTIKKLDRIEYAGLNKLGLLPGGYRFLSELEVEELLSL